MSLSPTKYIWMDGELVPWEDAKVHVLTHTLHYGLGVFEGIRCYDTKKGSAVFRLKDHMARFMNSADLVGMDLTYSLEELIEAVKITVNENELEECYIRPIGYYGYGKMGLNPEGAPVQVAIAAWPWGAYLGEEGLENGIRATITEWRRIHSKILPPHSKTVANYANSIFAKRDALDRGYDEAILLNFEGDHITEGPGENLFIVKEGDLITPPLSSGVLEGITRDSVMEIARDKGITVKEQDITIEELLSADEAFYTGTAAEITPIREVDGKDIGENGNWPITKDIQKTFFAAVNGEKEKYDSWLDYL